jgi:hypothetical protein
MDGANAANRRRSERVMLKVPVVVRIEASDHECMHQQADTMVVNAHGGLLRVGVELSPGQKIILINPKTHAEETCRVVRAEHLKSGDFAAAFEFGRPAPQFWPIVFPPADWESVEV